MLGVRLLCRPSSRGKRPATRLSGVTGRGLSKEYKEYPTSVQDLAKGWGRWATPDGGGGSDGAALRDIYAVDMKFARCRVGADLVAAYGVAQESVQEVVTLSNLASGEQAVFNVSRNRKPQTFIARGASLRPSGDDTAGVEVTARDFDPTRAGKRCDFCDPLRFTATDEFGRFETAHVMTASNLFKCAGQHGLILFRRHEPLGHTWEEVEDMFKAFEWWVDKAIVAASGSGCMHFYPMLVWNVLPRAGASQYHGHAQAMLTESVPPAIHRWSVLRRDAGLSIVAGHGPEMGFEGQSISTDYLECMMRAHRRVGLAREVLSPPAGGGGKAPGKMTGPPAHVWASMTPVQDMELVVYCKEDGVNFRRAFFAALNTLTCEMGVLTYNAAVYPLAPVSRAGEMHGGRGPTVARFVQRGNMTSAASDYGSLEVFCGTKVARTDPFTLVAALDNVLAEMRG